MPFCQFCGKQYPDGSSCDCAESQAVKQGNNNNSYNPYADGSFSSVENKSNPIQNAVNSLNVSEGGNGKKQVIGLACIGGAVLVVLLVFFKLISGGSYKKPVNEFVKGFNKADSEKIISSMLPDDYIDEIEDKLGDKWDDSLDVVDDSIEDYLEDLEDDYGKNVKMSVEFDSKKKADKDDIKQLEKIYDEVDAEVTKAYKVKAKMVINGKKDKDSQKVNLYVVKIKGDGWKLAPYEDLESLVYFTGIGDLF